MPDWLTLQDYSHKYKINISTLRRKIKNCEVEHTFKEGRYLLPDRQPPGYGEENTLRELKFLYQKLLEDKELELKKMKEYTEDLQNLVTFLETENREIEGLLKEALPALFIS